MIVGVSMFDVGYGGIQIQTLNHIKYSKHKYIIFADQAGSLSATFEALSNVKKIIYCHDYQIASFALQEHIEVFLHHTVNHTSRGSLNDLKKYKIPTMVFHHCAWKPLYNSSLADVFVTTSDSNIKIVKQNESFRTKQIEKVHLSLDFGPFKNLVSVEQIKKKWKIPLHKKVVGRVGRLEPGKCPEHFIQVAIQIKQKFPKVFFVVGGCKSVFESTNYIDSLKAMAAAGGLIEGRDILFTGILTEVEKANLINTFDVYLYPTNWEGYCMAFIEAMYLEKPVVTYAAFANDETVSKQNHTLGDVNGLTKETLVFLKNPEKAQEEGRTNRKLVIQRNKISTFVEKLDTLLDSLESKTKEIIRVIERPIPAEQTYNVCYVGWGLVDNMESTPEYLYLKHVSKMQNVKLDFFCTTPSGMATMNGITINRSDKFEPTLLKDRPSIVHINHAENPLSLQAAKWANSQGILLVMHVHSVKESIDKFIPYVNKFIALSDKECNLLAGKVAKNKIVVIANGIEIPRYKNLKRLDSFEKDKIHILYVGQMFAWKGIFNLLNVALLTNKYPNIMFHVVTHVRGEEAEFLKQRQKMRLKNRVRYYPSNHSERKFDDLLQFYGSSDIFLLLTENDCFPTTILEAMASGLPCIATDIGGIPNQIDHEATGFHVASRMVLGNQQAVSRIGQIVNDKALRIKLGNAGRAKATVQYNIDNQLTKLFNTYDTLTRNS